MTLMNKQGSRRFPNLSIHVLSMFTNKVCLLQGSSPPPVIPDRSSRHMYGQNVSQLSHIVKLHDHWRIWGGSAGAHPPTGSNSFVFAYIFAKKCPHQRLVPPTARRPPNGKSWIRH